jgi:integrase
VRHTFDRATAEAGIQDFHFHDLRHTFASWLAMKSIPINTIGELLDRTNPTQTLRYAHLSPTYLVSAVRVLDGVSDQASPEGSETTDLSNPQNIPCAR